jgi:hypothetical protein
MKTLFFTILLLVLSAAQSQGQFRDGVQSYDEYSATVATTPGNNTVGDWMNLLNMTMSHSYSMSFSNFGGQMQNLNAYTNHMNFDISERFNAQFDVSVLHSPFGNSYMGAQNDFGAKIIIDQARLDYRISDNAHISVQFSQRPYYNMGYGMFDRYGRTNPFSRSQFGY